MADPNTLVLNSILSELQKLNDFQKRQQRDAEGLAKVIRADQQTPVAPGLTRGAVWPYGGSQAPGALSANASTPDQLNTDQLAADARRANNQVASTRQTATSPNRGNMDEPGAQEAVAWSLLSEAGVGGPLGRLRQAQYSVGRNLDIASRAADRARDVTSAQAIDRMGTPSGLAASAANKALTPVSAALNWAQNNELKTTLGVMAISTGRQKANDWFEQGAALGYGSGNYGLLAGAGRGVTNAPTTMEGAAINQIVEQLRLGGPGGAAGARLGQGLTKQYAQDLVGQLFEAGFSPSGGGLPRNNMGNMGAIAQGLAPAVQAMGQQGGSIVGEWVDSLRSANTSVSDLTQMLQQMPKAAQASQLGLQRFDQAMQQVAQTVTGMGGTQVEGGRMALQFEQQHPGLNPQDLSGLLGSPFFQAFGLARGTLPSGISALPGGQINQMTQQTVGLLMNAMSGLAPQQQYQTLPDGRRVPMNNPQATVAQQVSSMLPGVSPQDILKIYNQDPKRQATISALQDQLGATNVGQTSGLQALTGGNDPNQWGNLSRQDQKDATTYWNKNIAPSLSSVLSPDKLREINQTGNISERAKLLNTDLFGAGNQGANQAGNAATVQLQIGLTQKAAQALTVSGSQRGHAKAVQNAGGATLNVTLNQPLGQGPTYGGIPRGNNNEPSYYGGGSSPNATYGNIGAGP